MLEGPEVTYTGQAFSVERARLGVPLRRPVPLYVGCYPFSPKALDLTGTLADGVVYVWTTPELVQRAHERKRRPGRATDCTP
jgi:alkanesulfonate monooxygenase SsuD/methylene tetrahydromethanopterin reductase-like flavin-dependent oxidoreductase (luciferase family)